MVLNGRTTLAVPIEIDCNCHAFLLHVFPEVGGGTTGSVIASRLTENPRVKVLVLEAGSDGTLLSLIPSAAPLMWSLDKFDYGYSSEPQEDSCLAFEGGVSRVTLHRFFAVKSYHVRVGHLSLKH